MIDSNSYLTTPAEKKASVNNTHYLSLNFIQSEFIQFISFPEQF